MGQSGHEGASEANESEKIMGQITKGLCTLLKFVLNPESNWSHKRLYTQHLIYVSER